MKNPPKSNIATSVRQRLLNLRQQRQEDFNLILSQYAIERFLYRISQSPVSDQFVLKGAILFVTWTGKLHRPTQDLDLLGYGENSDERLYTTIKQICEQPVEADGLHFDVTSIMISDIREEQKYSGKRAQLLAYLERARISLQIDIGFGDIVTPQAVWIDYPTLLQFPAPRLRTYTRESVVAEKVHAMVTNGIMNSRMKDFYDIWTLLHQFHFDGAILAQAIASTFGQRGTPIPTETPLALTTEFSENPMKVTQWQAFLRRNQLEVDGASFAGVVATIATFLVPPMQALASATHFTAS
ncbi:MAG: nucleotidyl transferase AbiEii/AbiGii toxin family protein [Caldilineaceae bacterium]